MYFAKINEAILKSLGKITVWKDMVEAYDKHKHAFNER